MTLDEALARARTSGRYLICASWLEDRDDGRPGLRHFRITHDYPTGDMPEAVRWLRDELSADIRLNAVAVQHTGVRPAAPNPVEQAAP